MKKLCSISQLDAQGRLVTWMEKKEVMALKHEGRIFVYSGMCPHQGGPLGEGILSGNMLTCPWHGCTFDITQGACVDLGTCKNVSGMKLTPIPFEVKDGEVYV